MTKIEEAAYIRGGDQARISVIRDCIRSMYDDKDSLETICGRLQAENLDMKNAIRELYAEMELPYYNEKMYPADLIRQVRRLTVKDPTL